MEHQIQGIKWMVGRETHGVHKGGFLCDEMGLGKTVQVIGTMMRNRLPRTLIIVPVSLVNQWIDHIKEWSDLSVSVLGAPNDTEVKIATYSHCLQSSKEYGKLFQHGWERVVLDEAHEVRNPKSKKFQAIMKIESGIRWIVTGTLIINGEKDYTTLLRFLTHDEIFEEQRWDVILKRRKKIINLPKIEFENIRLEPYEEEKVVYKKVFKDYDGTSKKVLHGIMKLRQIGIHPMFYDKEYTGRSKRIDTLIEMIQAHSSEKSLVFCQFKKEMKLIKSLLGCEVFELSGSTPMHSRPLIVEQFNRSVPGSVFIIQIKSGGVGLNLQCATCVYLTCPAWNPATELQAISRSHRIGQDKPVHVYKLFYSGLEEAIMQLQESKSRINARIFDDPSLIDELPMPVDLEKKLILISNFFVCTE